MSGHQRHDANRRGAITGSNVTPTVRRIMVGVALGRIVIPLAAIPLVPLLIRDHLPLLILIRPTKEFLLLGGGRVQLADDLSITLLFALYAPLMILAVWPFFVVGRAYGGALRAGDAPPLLQRALPQRQLDLAHRVLSRKGPAIAILGRMAAIPPTVLAAAAGASHVPARRYLVADVIGGVTAFAVTVGAGLVLGEAYERGGVWLAAIGVAVFFVLVGLLARWIRHEARGHPGPARGHPGPPSGNAG